MAALEETEGEASGKVLVRDCTRTSNGADINL